MNDDTVDGDDLPLLDVHDGRTPRQLVADGDGRWPDGRVYLPPHLKGRHRRRFLRALLLAEPELPDERDRRRQDFARAGGAVLCPQCGEKYYDHPADPGEPDLTIACSRERLKL